MSRGRKSNPVAPGNPSQAPQPPVEMTPKALLEWQRVVPCLEAGGAVQEVDLAVLVAYCETYVLWFEVRGALTAWNVVDERGRLNPLARFCGEQLKQLRGLCDQLGFTPAARKQILSGRGGPTLEDVLK